MSDRLSWAIPGQREKKLAVLLFVFGILALFTAAVIAMLGLQAGKFLTLPRFLLVIPLWGAVAVFLAVRLASGREQPALFVGGCCWLVLGFLPAVWAQFLA